LGIGLWQCTGIDTARRRGPIVIWICGRAPIDRECEQSAISGRGWRQFSYAYLSLRIVSVVGEFRGERFRRNEQRLPQPQ